jgi:hypothetical protein
MLRISASLLGGTRAPSLLRGRQIGVPFVGDGVARREQSPNYTGRAAKAEIPNVLSFAPQMQYRQNNSNQRMTSAAVPKAVAMTIVSGVNA